MSAEQERVHTIGLMAVDRGAAARDHLADLRRLLADGGARAGEPDQLGVFVARVPAASRADALRVVYDAIAAVGADDHVAFIDHPEVPRHWRRWHVDSGEVRDSG
ncbi:hypothetical protein [Conexibacter arvalis]|uniref:Uncharacterized protein n=1 Tax=Conexibacter arvalis TaxID=912552 RepID=A0A840IIU9_9ACTN|nr:hypothetical protein [Conexibacter arvalis]MBB4664902.1 hypothetical protein [Conexibacter arvalis]